MIALYIIGGILLFLLLVLLIPVRAEISFREEFSLTVGYLFLKLRLLPGEEETEEQEEEKTEKKKEKQDKEEKNKGGGQEKIKGILKRHGFWGFVESLLEAAALAASSSKRLLSHVRIKRFDLYLCLAGAENAADAAIQYGQLSAAVYSACGILFRLIRIRKKAVTVDLDYRAQENLVDFSAKLSLRPLFAVKEAVFLLIKALLILKKLMGPGKKSQRSKPVSQQAKPLIKER